MAKDNSYNTNNNTTTTDISTLSGTDISTLTTTDIGALSTDEVTSIISTQVEALVSTQIDAIMTTTVEALVTTQIEAIVTQAEPTLVVVDIPVVTTVDVTLSSVTTFLNDYVKYMSRSVPNKAALTTGVKAFVLAVRAILANPTQESLDYFWNFFIEHKDTLMHERSGLRGVTTIDKATRHKVETFYTLFRNATTGNSLSINTQTASNILKQPIILAYLATKTPKTVD